MVSSTVASASEQASANVQSVSSASEELTASISEISQQVARSTESSKSAVNDVDAANEKIKSLDEAGQKIGEVVSLISEIAEQTSLDVRAAELAARHGTDAEFDTNFVMVAALDEQWPDIDADMSDLLVTMGDNIDNYAAVDALPSFDLFPWFFVIPAFFFLGISLEPGNEDDRYQGEDARSRIENEIGAHHPGDGAAGPDGRQIRM